MFFFALSSVLLAVVLLAVVLLVWGGYISLIELGLQVPKELSLPYRIQMWDDQDIYVEELR